jgi:hypothetical protein
MNPKTPLSMPPHAPDDDDDALQSLWKRQERALRSVREDLSPTADADATDADPDASAYRALFAALARERLPQPPVDFARSTAATAERLADARRQVARFRRRLGGLLGLLYLPAMLMVGLMYIPKLWRMDSPAASGDVSLSGWLMAIIALALLSLAVDRQRDGRSAVSGDTH